MVDFRLLRAARKPGDYQRLEKLAKLAAESPEFGERFAARAALNRQISARMPMGDSCLRALDIMEWAHESSEAAASAPDEVVAYKAFFAQVWNDSSCWRTAFDMALEIWKRAHEDHLRKQAAF